jgi:hypothetical protein
MVYHIQNYWLFLLFPSSGILGTRKHDVSERDPVSETCFLVPRIPDDGKSPKTRNSEHSKEPSGSTGCWEILE